MNMDNIAKEEKMCDFKTINIEGYEKYEINMKGQVRHIKSKIILKVMIYKDKKYNTMNYYYSLAGMSNGIYKTRCFNIHHLLARMFIPNPECKKYVLHIDGNKLNNSLKNLKWVDTPKCKQHYEK